MKDRVKFRFVLLTLCCLAALSVGIFALRGLANLAVGGAPPPNVSILPADHGLANTIAGYQLLAVKTSETTACMPPGRAILLLRVDASSEEEMMSTDVNAVFRELERLDPDSGVSWALELLPPYATSVEIAAANAQVNVFFAEHDCPQRLRGPFIRQPTPP